MRVLIIPENPTLDQYILKPVVTRIFHDLRCKARIEVLQDPHLNGVDEALDKDILESILKDRRMFDLFLLIVDRDGDPGRESGRLGQRVEQARQMGKSLIGCLAVEEVEVWALALHLKTLASGWSDVRKEKNPKEVYFDPLVKQENWTESLGKGRTTAMKALRENWKTLKSRCPEIQYLQKKIGDWLQSR